MGDLHFGGVPEFVFVTALMVQAVLNHNDIYSRADAKYLIFSGTGNILPSLPWSCDSSAAAHDYTFKIRSLPFRAHRSTIVKARRVFRVLEH
jgi:hypothetical protein